MKSLSFRSGLALENTKVISSGRRRLRGGWWLVFARVQILVCPSPPPHAASIRACPITSSPIVKLASMHWHFGNKALLQLPPGSLRFPFPTRCTPLSGNSLLGNFGSLLELLGDVAPSRSCNPGI